MVAFGPEIWPGNTNASKSGPEVRAVPWLRDWSGPPLSTQSNVNACGVAAAIVTVHATDSATLPP